MAFRVEISREAFQDLDRIASYIQEKTSAAIAERWFNGIFAAMHTLREMPSHCAIAEESAELDAEVHLLLHGKRKRLYKVYFAIYADTLTVRILHVRHWARKPVEADELADLMDETAESGIEEGKTEETGNA